METEKSMEKAANSGSSRGKWPLLHVQMTQQNSQMNYTDRQIRHINTTQKPNSLNSEPRLK